MSKSQNGNKEVKKPKKVQPKPLPAGAAPPTITAAAPPVRARKK
jgi:hypothetical protein